jgi:glycosyltransferase involved in cell wall biosynthesis
MRILMVTTSYPLFEGDGTAPFIRDIVRGLLARGHEVDLVLPAHPALKPERQPGLLQFPFEYAPWAVLNVWGYALSMTADRHLKWRTVLVAPFALLAMRRAIHARLRADHYDLVHAHWVVPAGFMSSGPARAAVKPLVISLHGSDVAGAERSALAGRAARRAFQAAHAVTACSSDLRDRALRLGAPAGSTSIVPYGVDSDFFGSGNDRDDGRLASMRHRLGARPSQVLVVAVGRLVEKKGFSYLIEAIRGTNGLHLAIIGDGDLQNALQEQSEAMRALVTLAGRFSRCEVRDALRCADIVAVPSIVDSSGNVDGLPNTLLEAMAAGKAIVASRVAGIPDVLTDGAEGILVPQRDSRSIQKALTHLVADASWRRALGERAAQRVQRDLTWDRVALGIEECYGIARASLARPADAE